MEAIHSATSGPTQQDDSWTCHRCGWVYPNAHPSAKHRRNHKKHCGKIKGFELQSELHKGGSSDEASSDDGSHAHKEKLLLQSSQTQHDSIRPSETSSELLVVDPPSASQSRGNIHDSDRPAEANSELPVVDPPSTLQSRELFLPETNISKIQRSETPALHSISASIDNKPEVPAYESTGSVDLVDVKPESSPESVPNNLPLDETSKILGNEKDIKTKHLPGEITQFKASETPEGHGNVGLESQAGVVDVAEQDAPDLFSNQVDDGIEKGSTLEGAVPKPVESKASLDKLSKSFEGGGHISSLPSAGNADKVARESKVLDLDKAREAQKKEISTTPAEHLVNRQGSSQEDDSWTCRRCGWVYPNPHPSAKHRRNHKKNCGKLKGFEVHAELHKGGSSDEVSSDEDKKEHIQDTQIVQAQNQASGMRATDTSTLVGDLGSSTLQSTVPITSKGDFSGGGLPDTSSLNSNTPSMHSTDAGPKYTVSSEQENLPEGEEKGAAFVNHTSTAPIESQGLGISLAKEERPSNQVSSEQENLPEGEGKGAAFVNHTLTAHIESQGLGISLAKEERPSNQESLLDAVRSSISSEGLSNRLNETPHELGSESKVAEGLHKHSEDCTPVVENIHPTDVDRAVPSSISSEDLSNPLNETPHELGSEFKVAEGLHQHSEDCTPVVENSQPADVGRTVPIIDPKASGLASESLEAFAEPVSYQDVDPTEKSDDVAERVKPNSLAGQTLLQGDLPSDSALVPTAVNLHDGEADNSQFQGSSVREIVSPMVALSIPANATGSANDSELEEKFASVQATPNSVKLPLDVSGQIAGGGEDASSSFVDKGIFTAQMMENPLQFLDKPGTSVGEAVSEERTDLADTSGEALSSNDTSASRTIPSEFQVIPERAPLASVGDKQVLSSKDEVSDQLVEAQNTPSSSIDKVVETPQVTEIPVQSLDNPGTLEEPTVSYERFPADTNGKSSLINDKPTTSILSSEFEITPVKAISASVGDSLASSTFVDMAMDPTLPNFSKEMDFKQLSLEKDTDKEKSGEAMGPLEVLDKPETKHESFHETEIGSYDQSLDEINSFKNAESELSHRSEFAASSHKLSDSLELFEDAADTLEACSVGGSIEETESLDEPRQVADGVQEGSKLSRDASSDKTVPGATNELERKSNVSTGASAADASIEDKAVPRPAGTSHAVVLGKMEELKAPSPEAWQEPGPSTLKKEGIKLNISEVLEDGKSGESHTALRSLMAKEGKDVKTDQAGASSSDASDAKVADIKGASAYGAKPKSRLKSFWSQCVCCPAVH